MSDRKNILFVITDQFRADLLHGALAAHVDLPNLRAFMGESVAFRSHFSVCNPCGPSRASILTGQYAMNHRSVRNGVPLPADKPNLAKEARKAGYQPLLFGYNDASHDPRGKHPNDPALKSYEEVMPGFDVALEMSAESSWAWRGDLAAKGYDVSDYQKLFESQGDRPSDPAIYKAEDSDTAFLTDRVLEQLAVRPKGWFAHVTYIRPHPPFVAPEPYNKMYDPASLPPPVVSDDVMEHPFQRVAVETTDMAKFINGFGNPEQTPELVAELRAVYLGLATEVDHHIGRMIQFLKDSGQYDDTLILITADHGEMLGDQRQWGKNSYHDAAFHVPLLIRNPDQAAQFGTAVDAPTETVDITPTMLSWMGVDVPHSMDGQDLSPFLAGETPHGWKEHSFAELDFGNPINPTNWQVALDVPIDSSNFSILRTKSEIFVHFAGDFPQVLINRDGSDAGRNRAGDAGDGKKNYWK